MIRRCYTKCFIRNGYTIILISLILLGCNPVRYVPENQYLLKSNKIETKGGAIPDRDLENYFRQQPNKKIFGFLRFHLGVYNLSNPVKKNGFNNWLRKIGEEPVIFNPAATNETLNQLKHYLQNVGYYNARIDDTISFARKKASVVYRVDFGTPYVVDHVRLTSPELVTDSAIRNLIRLDSTSSLLKPAMRYDLEVLRLERMRLSNYLRNNGYYGFSREYVYFPVDTMKGNHKVDVWMGIKNPKDAISDVSMLSFHPLYRIGNISIITDFNTSDYLRDPKSYLAASDTTTFQGTNFVFKNRLSLKPGILHSSVAFQSGSLFSQSLVDKTIESFSSLRNFKQIKVNFTPDENPADSI
ncbi:MAG: hypothetical protein NTV01_02860, partial [Bacteroidia bacterium]|nr:hypothetical protein [Bacteroidia bacterium]